MVLAVERAADQLNARASALTVVSGLVLTAAVTLLATVAHGKRVDFAATVLAGLSLFSLLNAQLAHTGRDKLVFPANSDNTTTLGRPG